MIFKASNDQVPNVREVCLKVLRDIALKWEKNAIKDVIKKHVSAMTEDSDREVREKALEIMSRV